MADKKYLDYDGLLYFWQKIKARFDGAIASISGDGSSTTITFTKVDGTTGTFVTKDTTYSAATQTDAGLMSAADKKKLDGIATGANKTTVDSSLSSTSTNPVQNKVINSALADKAPLASPALTGTPTAPTAAAGTNTTQIATTAFVQQEIDANALTVDSAMSSSSTNPVQNKVINTELGKKANLASPTFTGTPKAPTAAAGTNSTQIATTAFVKTAVDNAVSGLYKYKGSVATASDLPTTGNVTGDVWDIQQTSTYGPPGTNVVWNGTAWDALGGLFEITTITNTEIDTICAA